MGTSVYVGVPFDVPPPSTEVPPTELDEVPPPPQAVAPKVIPKAIANAFEKSEINPEICLIPNKSHKAAVTLNNKY